MSPTTITEVLAANQPFALLSRADGDYLDLLTGELTTVSTLAQLPLPAGTGPQTLALVPFRQITERGFDCVDDDAPLLCLRVTGHQQISREAAVAELPDAPVAATDIGFDIGDEEYGKIVDAVLRDEIAHGEGANFVIHRTYHAQLTVDPMRSAAAALRMLLLRERGAYWTFLVHTGERTFVGATPERHVSVDDGLVMMNPISGTFRCSAEQPDRDALLRFLSDRKEINELYMVLDEELKMMATVADRGGQVIGPYLKEMAHLVHTEYLLAGRGSLDVREVLRETMFAPTVTGSPIENACRVIARHERRGRGYYSGVLALLGNDSAGRQTLDAPILIRCAEIDRTGRLKVSVGATLVRDSTAAGEVAETHTKATGILSALGLRTGRSTGTAVPTSRGLPRPLADDIQVQAALARRNDHLARFWLEDRNQATQPTPPAFDGTVLVVDAEDTFTGMLVHELRALGLAATLCPWHDPRLPQLAYEGFDLVVPGPGPGDPTDPGDAKMSTLRRLIRQLLERGQPMLAVCLGHQLLAGRLGLTLHRWLEPYQGLQREINLFGRPRRVGYYASFTALATGDQLDTSYGRVALCRDPAERTVHALRGETFAGVQFHPESVLTEHGPEILTELITPLIPSCAVTPG